MSIENGARGLAFSSGLAATDCLMRGLKPGDEVIAMDDLYGELTDCLRKFIKIQVYYSILYMNDMEKFKSLINENTKLVWVETPTNR
jgi:cystathionine beta-lyase